MNKTVLIAAGGTGGHFYPALALARELKAQGLEPVFLLAGQVQAQPLLDQEGFAYRMIAGKGLPRKISLKLFTALAELAKGILATRNHLKELKPALVIGMGSYASFAAIFCAWAARIPTMIHEQNVKPGLTNRILSRVASRIALGFPDSEPYFAGRSTIVTGNPIRKDVWGKSKAASLTALGLKPNLFTVLVFGGSQGAHRLNESVVEAMTLLPTPSLQRLQILHLCGAKDAASVQSAYGRLKVEAKALSYLEDMGSAYAAADLVICRSGASTVTELMAVKKPAILIPFPFATGNHQEFNARVLERLGAALVILEKDLNPSRIAQALTDFSSHPDKLSAMTKAHESSTLPLHTSTHRLAQAAQETIAAA